MEDFTTINVEAAKAVKAIDAYGRKVFGTMVPKYVALGEIVAASDEAGQARKALAKASGASGSTLTRALTIYNAWLASDGGDGWVAETGYDVERPTITNFYAHLASASPRKPVSPANRAASSFKRAQSDLDEADFLVWVEAMRLQLANV